MAVPWRDQGGDIRTMALLELRLIANGLLCNAPPTYDRLNLSKSGISSQHIPKHLSKPTKRLKLDRSQLALEAHSSDGFIPCSPHVRMSHPVMQTFIMPAPIRSLFSHACPPIIPNQPTQIYTHRKRRTPPRVVCSARVQHVSARNGVALGLRLDARFDLQDACMSVRGSRKRCFRKRQDAHNALQAMEP
jgi:hypothetical protein